MRRIDNFLSEVYSEEIFSVSESDYDEVMRLAAEDDFSGYEEFSQDVEASFFSEGDVENFETVNGQLRYKGESLKQGQRIGGIDV